MSRFVAVLTFLVAAGAATQTMTACSVGEVPLNGGGDDTPGPDAGSGSQNLRCGPRTTPPVTAHQHNIATSPALDGNPTAKGVNCMTCHAAGGTGPTFTAGGTVYKPDKVSPQAGVTVRLIPGNGQPVITAITDDAGNFRFEGTIPFPAQTDACFDDKQAIMLGPINGPADANCNSAGCHQEPGGVYGAIKLAD